jgi:hypothetical protein
MTALLKKEAKQLSKKEDKVIQSSYLEVLEKSNEEVSLLEEPPAWHEAIVEERYKEWIEGKIESQDLDEAIKELKAELGIER